MPAKLQLTGCCCNEVLQKYMIIAVTALAPTSALGEIDDNIHA